MTGNGPYRGGRGKITRSFNNGNPWGDSGPPDDDDYTERANNGYSGHTSKRKHSGGPHVTSIGDDVKNFFSVLFSFIKGIWTQDFADFDLLSSVYFPPQPASKIEPPAPQQQGTAPAPQAPPRQSESTLPPTQPLPAPSPQTKQGEAPGPSTQPEGTGKKPSEEFKDASSLQATSPETKPQSRAEEKTKPADERTAAQKSVDLMKAMRADPNHPNWKLPLGKLTRLLTQGIQHPKDLDDMIQQVLLIEGGDKINRNEPNGGISKYGINSIANPGIDIENLTEKDAIKIIREKYWRKIQWPGGDPNKMSQAVQFLALDTAVNSQTYANELLDKSYRKAEGDVTRMPKIMLDMRAKRFERLVEQDPKTYKKYEKGWEKRIEDLRELVSHYAMTVPTTEMAAKLYALRPVDLPPSSDFGHRHDPITGKHNVRHQGTDYPTSIGTPVPAKLEGTVFKAGTFGGYGNTLIISHKGVYFEMYAHLDKIFKPKAPDGHFEVGEKMAETGNTGRTTGPHLHHEIWLFNDKDKKFYVIDEKQAFNKDLNDPAVRQELINHAKESPDIFLHEPSLMKNTTFKNEALKLTERDHAHLDRTLVAAAPSTPELITR